MEATEIQQHEIAEIEEFADKRDTMLGEIRKVIVGQDQVIEEVLIALFARGHCLLVGVPGLAKTLLISTLAEILDLDFNRIQFTPDLMPSDITGTDILQEDAATGRRHFNFSTGRFSPTSCSPTKSTARRPRPRRRFCNRCRNTKSPRAARTYPLDLPFFVLATQNPIEQEGTYPLPEAQLDRFMLNIEIRYPDFDDEVQIVMQTTSTGKPSPQKIMDGPAILRYQDLVRKGAGLALRDLLRGRPGAKLAAAKRRRFAVRQGLRRMGRRPARFAVFDPRRQSAHDSAGPLRSFDRRYSSARSFRAPPPHRAQLQGSRRRALLPRYHQPAFDRYKTFYGRQEPRT